MSSLANEEPLVIMKACVNVVWEVIGEDCCYGSSSMVGDGKAPLCHGGDQHVSEQSFGSEDGDVGCDRGVSSHQGSEVFSSRGGDKDIVRVNSDIFMEWGE